MGMGNVRVAKVGVGLVSWGRGLTWVSEVGKGGWVHLEFAEQRGAPSPCVSADGGGAAVSTETRARARARARAR